ncbi:MAG TPA: tetratricopeptide repeat protein, partial [Chthonomonadaceae bacterium]|nr:tetratricopeptide repeat protein [Chthonomonadaceae bacterium]
LFKAVFGGMETFSLYANVTQDLGNTRIVIHAESPEGIALPWELMRDPTKGEFGDLAHLAHAFVRSDPSLRFQPASPPSGDTFNILMVICRPKGDRDVGFQSVARPLLELFRPHRDRIRLDILRPPTFEQLSKVLTANPGLYHVLHFDGHGTFPSAHLVGDRFYAQPGAQGHLIFEGEDGSANPVTGAELGSLLAKARVPAVLLNACQSGMTLPEAAYTSVGNQLLKAGAGGVVAMAYSVYVPTAVRFMARLYEALIQGKDLAQSCTLAREALRDHPQRSSAIGPIDLQDWIVPILFEAAPVQLTARPIAGLRLTPDVLKDQQAQAGAEIGCPDPPAFGFVGRDGVLLELERAFQKETVVLLQGMAGVGKTEAAAGFARWRAETGALDGPIFFFRFEHYLPLAQVCDRVGQVFQPAIKAQLNLEWELLDAAQRRNVALTVLKQVPCLLVWDNFEPVAGFPQGAPSDWTPPEQQELRQFLSDLRNGQTKVLLTSRRDEPWLGNLYRLVALRGLKRHEAQELAVKVLERAGLQPHQIKQLSDYNALLDYLTGNPLAIQVILPELKRVKPDTLLQSLQTGTLQLPQDDHQQGREHSLAASLTYRLDKLDPTLHQRLGILGLFQGFVNAGVLAALSNLDGAPDLLAGLQPADWIRTLDTAAEVGLLRNVGTGYYTVHPALPWFFHDLMHEAFPDHLDWLERAFTEVYGGYSHHLFQLFQTRTQFAMNLLDAEENNLTYAIRLARKQKSWSVLHGILYGVMRLLKTQGRWVEWERMLTEIEAEVANTAGEPLSGTEGLRRSLLAHRQEIAGYRRDFATQEALLLRLKEHYEEAGDEKNVAAIFHQLGMIAEERRAFEEAERWYRQSLEIAQRIGDEHGQAATLHQLGSLAQERRAFEEAERWYRQSLEIKQRIGDEHGQAATLHQLGMIAEERRAFEEAEQWYRQSLEIEQRIGDEYGQASTLHQLGRIAEEQDNGTEALRFYESAVALFSHLNDPYSLAVVQRSIQRVKEANSGTDASQGSQS